MCLNPYHSQFSSFISTPQKQPWHEITAYRICAWCIHIDGSRIRTINSWFTPLIRAKRNHLYHYFQGPIWDGSSTKLSSSPWVHSQIQTPWVGKCWHHSSFSSKPNGHIAVQELATYLDVGKYTCPEKAWMDESKTNEGIDVVLWSWKEHRDTNNPPFLSSDKQLLQ